MQLVLTIFAAQQGRAGPDKLLIVEDRADKHFGHIGDTKFGAAFAVDFNITGFFDLRLQIFQADFCQNRTFPAQLQKGLAADKNT